MPQHLISRRFGSGIELIFYVGPDEQFTYDVTRTAIGCSFPDENGEAYACVVGERTYYSKEEKPATRIYPILDEARVNSANDLLDALITLKDKWLVDTVHCPLDPFSETVKKQEGLTHYSRDEYENRQIWKTYQDNSTIASVRDISFTPSDVRRLLDTLMSQTAADPDTRRPILDGEGRPTPRLWAMAELNTQHASACLQPGMDSPEASSALYLACNGLEKSRPPHPRIAVEDEGFTRKTGRGGY